MIDKKICKSCNEIKENFKFSDKNKKTCRNCNLKTIFNLIDEMTKDDDRYVYYLIVKDKQTNNFNITSIK